MHNEGPEVVIVLEDLNLAGYPRRHKGASQQIANLGLRWLAYFHASFLGEKPRGLWKTGTYWHLATRKEELERMSDLPLKNAASEIDALLRGCRYQTFVHGDAKLANFCFCSDNRAVAALDFQYVGGGCGIRDVAYFLDSCFTEDTCERLAPALLDFYFSSLKKALIEQKKHVDFPALEKEWRNMYPVAWTDFYRFLKGWTSSYWNPSSYSERMAKGVIERLNPTKQTKKKK
ncbi:hypothetical protein CHISP_1809 [Chitinispirillum alkaliphilum]|nr:hypothetical protein CHISP_1809 [Chitinispirillum alkaliphilum]